MVWTVAVLPCIYMMARHHDYACNASKLNGSGSPQLYAFTTSFSSSCAKPGSAFTTSAARHKVCNDMAGLFFSSDIACIQQTYKFCVQLPGCIRHPQQSCGSVVPWRHCGERLQARVHATQCQIVSCAPVDQQGGTAADHLQSFLPAACQAASLSVLCCEPTLPALQ